jgi:hypothetical protein
MAIGNYGHFSLEIKEAIMKRKLITLILSVAVTLALIPTLAAYADDEQNQEGTSAVVLEDIENEDVPEVEENEDADLDEGEDVELELPKINLKSPVSQFVPSEIGTQYTLTARVGEKVIDAALITWTSDNESVATVSPEGVVTVVGLGKANFTAVMIDGTARNGYAKVFVFADKSKDDKAPATQSGEHKKHK